VKPGLSRPLGALKMGLERMAQFNHNVVSAKVSFVLIISLFSKGQNRQKEYGDVISADPKLSSGVLTQAT
jgi:hypothetical protein